MAQNSSVQRFTLQGVAEITNTSRGRNLNLSLINIKNSYRGGSCLAECQLASNFFMQRVSVTPLRVSVRGVIAASLAVHCLDLILDWINQFQCTFMKPVNFLVKPKLIVDWWEPNGSCVLHSPLPFTIKAVNLHAAWHCVISTWT